MRSTIIPAISVVLFDLLQHKVREISLSKQIYSHIISGSSRKWSDSTWTHRKQLEQLLQQVTTRGHHLFEAHADQGLLQGKQL